MNKKQLHQPITNDALYISSGAGSLDTPDNDNEGELETSGEGKLLATEIVNKNAADMREFISARG